LNFIHIQYVREVFSRFGWKRRILSEWGGKADFYAMPNMNNGRLKFFRRPCVEIGMHGLEWDLR